MWSKVQGLPGVLAAAGVADEAVGVAVVLHHALAPGGLVQVVDVLGDDAQQQAPGLQCRQGVMGRIGPGTGDDRVHLLQQGPDLGRVIPKGPDVGVFHGIEALPEAAGAAEVGDAGLHRDAGAG